MRPVWNEGRVHQQREITPVCIRASRAFEHSCTCRMAFGLHYFWPFILTAMFPLQYLSSYTNTHPKDGPRLRPIKNQECVNECLKWPEKPAAVFLDTIIGPIQDRAHQYLMEIRLITDHDQENQRHSRD